MYTIGYDVGSSSIKIALVEAKTHKKVAVITEPQQEMPIHAPQSDWAEQDPNLWWGYVCSGTKRLLKENNIDPKHILAVGISYQMHGLVLVDKNHQSLRNAIIWCDSRAVEIGENAAAALGEAKYGPHLFNAPGNFTASKLKWVKEHESEVYEKIHHYILPGDYIALQLTGEIATTINGLSEGILWDYKEKKVADWMLAHYGIDSALTPPIVSNFEDQGKVTEQASIATGLPKNIPIRYRAGDQPNNALSLNILKPGEVAATGGTSGVLFAVSERETSKEFYRVNHFAHVNYTPATPTIGTLLCINGAGIQYSWLRKMTQISEFSEMNEKAEQVPIGAEGLINLPFGNGAERMLYNRTPGAQFCNLNLNRHHQGHLCRAALEGIAFSFAYGMEIMQEDNLTINVIRAGNDNLFRSSLFSTTVASLLGQPIEIFDTTGAIGAARAAGIENKNLELFSAQLASLDKVAEIQPIASNEPYVIAYNHWKKTLETNLNNLKH